MKFKSIFAIILVNVALIASVTFLLVKQNQTDVVSEPAQADTVEKLTKTDMASAPLVYDLLPYQNVSLYGVMLEDGGVNGPAIGCGDSLVPMRNYDSEQYRNVEGGLVLEALRELLAISNEDLKGEFKKGSLYTGAYQPNLTIEKASLDDNIVNVFMNGNLSFGGTCDVPRFEEQLEATAVQFEGINRARFYLNGSEENFREALSGQ